jgi:hypothetical protein
MKEGRPEAIGGSGHLVRVEAGQHVSKALLGFPANNATHSAAGASGEEADAVRSAARRAEQA